MSSTLLDEAEPEMAGDLLTAGEIDLVAEMRLRTWARKNYVSAAERDGTWHPVILDEMVRIDEELLLE